MKELRFPFYPENAQAMTKYLKNQFEFCGVRAPERQKIEAPYLKQSKALTSTELFALVEANYQKKYREYQYYAIDLVQANIKRLSLLELKAYVLFVGQQSWWESVDTWRKVFSTFVKLHPEMLSEVFSWFDGHANFWYRRIAITLQLQLKSATDRTLLTKAILADRLTNEFFVQKAIGWALRDFSKTDPVWVKNFITTYDLSKLARNEGSKYI